MLVIPVAVEFITAGFHCVYILALLSENVDVALRTWVADTPSANPLRWRVARSAL